VSEAAVRIRPAVAADAAPLLALMRALARFEGYDAGFAVREADLLARGLAPAGAPEFTAFVAEDGRGALAGYAVVLEIAFTFDLAPTLVLKELFVDADSRARGIGAALLARVRAHALARGCRRLEWRVLPGNARAQAFYRRAGGAPDRAWEHWTQPLG
jgi:GNAT superfamily N-acetyltransferase